MMNIVIALKEFPAVIDSSFGFVAALCRNRGKHEVILTLDGRYARTVDRVRSAFEGILPQENIRLWYSPADIAFDSRSPAGWQQKVGQLIQDGFLKSLSPDVVLDTDVAELGGIIALIGPIGPIPTIGNDFDELARQALGALDMWHEQHAAAVSCSQMPSRRPRLAYLSPLPPEHSGISDYSTELLQELSRYYEIDVVVEQKTVADQWVRKNCAIRTVAWFRNHAGRYDRVLYHFGNSPFHLHMFDLLAEFPGVAVMHDFFLSDILEYRDCSGMAPGCFAAALYHSHGYTALLRFLAAPASCRDIVATYPCNFNILQHATGVILHSGYAKSLALKFYGDSQNKRMAMLPLLRATVQTIDRAEARRSLGFEEDQVIVCSFGMPDSHKLSHLLLEAWQASSLRDDYRCTLVFVGEILQNEYCRKLQKDIEFSGSRIRVTGWVPIEEYRRYLSASDIGVQLRTISRGESSGSVLDCMNYGMATIVNANGSMAELPAECVIMLPDDVSVDELKMGLETLRADALLRQRIGRSARNYVYTERSPALIAEQYAAAIERFSQSPEAIRNSIVHQVAHLETVPDDEGTLFSIAEGIVDTFHVAMQRQLLIDVSALVLVDLKTGIQRVVRSIVKTLIDNPPDGFRVEPVYAAPDAPYRYARSFTLKSFGFPENTLVDEVVEIKPKDILFVPDLHFQVVQSQKDYFLKIRNIGAAVFFLVHDILPLRRPDFFPEGTLNDFEQWLHIVAQADGAICVSRTVADDLYCWLNQVQPYRLRPFAIGWNHHGADIAASIPSKGLPDGFDETLLKLAKAPTILMVGTVEPRKGHLQVLKACEMLWIMGMKVNLVIVGKKGWMVDKVSKRLKRHNKLNRQCVWYQDISDEALQKLYKAASGILMASEGEGFGLPLIEAAQHKCPILARDLPVFREVAGTNAAYFSGNSPLKLAKALKSWIGRLNRGSAPQSSGMLWLTWQESTSQLIRLLTDSQNLRWVYRWSPSANSGPTKKADGKELVRKSPKCIAVDLTLVLPGGENGGAKVFLLELLRMLARMQPKTLFLILTRESSHDELAFLERRNMRRIMVVTDATASASESNEKKITGLARRFSSWAERTVKRWKRSVMKRIGGNRLKKQGLPASGKTLREMGVELFFCPFTSLERAEPGIPSVCTIHDLQYKTYPEFFTAEDIANRDRLFLDACRRADGLTAISEYSRQSAIIHGNLDPSRIRTIHHRMAQRISSDKDLNNTLLNTLFGRLGLIQKEYLLYPANFWQHKNHEMLLAAFDIASRNELPATMKLVCTGAPTERRELLIGKVCAMGLSERIIFPGYLLNNELAVLLSNSAGLIFPSLYEGFGLPVIEAMASGIPVACSNTRALPEIVSGAALLFNPEKTEEIAKALVSLTNDEALRERLIEAGLLRSKEFSDMERMGNEYWELFEDAVNR